MVTTFQMQLNKKAGTTRCCVKRSFGKFSNRPGRTPVVESRLDEVIDQQPTSLLKKRLRNTWFPVNFSEII